jgi:hypothetical protein
MKIIFAVLLSLILITAAFGEDREIGYLLFAPDYSDKFADDFPANQRLDEMADMLKSQDVDHAQVIVYGYAAFAANEIDPMQLSIDRAAFIINELVGRGVNKDYFAAPVGLGAVEIYEDYSQEDFRSLNRRVNVEIKENIVAAADQYVPVNNIDWKTIALIAGIVIALAVAVTLAVKYVPAFMGAAVQTVNFSQAPISGIDKIFYHIDIINKVGKGTVERIGRRKAAEASQRFIRYTIITSIISIVLSLFLPTWVPFAALTLVGLFRFIGSIDQIETANKARKMLKMMEWWDVKNDKMLLKYAGFALVVFIAVKIIMHLVISSD